jgi:hypothetical protein
MKRTILMSVAFVALALVAFFVSQAALKPAPAVAEQPRLMTAQEMEGVWGGEPTSPGGTATATVPGGGGPGTWIRGMTCAVINGGDCSTTKNTLCSRNDAVCQPPYGTGAIELGDICADKKIYKDSPRCADDTTDLECNDTDSNETTVDCYWRWICRCTRVWSDEINDWNYFCKDEEQVAPGKVQKCKNRNPS